MTCILLGNLEFTKLFLDFYINLDVYKNLDFYIKSDFYI